MRAGQLRHRVTFQAAVGSGDGQGGTTRPTPSTAFTVWAQVEYLSGRELMEAQRLSAEATVRIRMRFRADVTAKLRASWVNKGVTHTFAVQAYQPADPQNEELHVFCAEVQV